MERQLKIIAYLLARIIAFQTRSFAPEKILEEAERAVPITKTAARKRGFFPPTVEEVVAYCKHRGFYTVDPQTFVSFYESKGWMVGKNKMTSWKSAVGTWERNNRKKYGNSEPEKVGGDDLFSQQPKKLLDYDSFVAKMVAEENG